MHFSTERDCQKMHFFVNLVEFELVKGLQKPDLALKYAIDHLKHNILLLSPGN